MHFNCTAEVQLKIYWSIFDCAIMKLLEVGLMLKNVHCAQEVLQIKLNYNFI